MNREPTTTAAADWFHAKQRGERLPEHELDHGSSQEPAPSTCAKSQPNAERRSRLDPIKEAKAAATLRESLRQMGEGDDETLLLDTLEGETSLFEAIDRLLLAIVETEGLAEGARRAADQLDARCERLENRAESLRALIEQALFVADLDKLERPAATLSITRRGPKVEITEEAEIPAEFWKAGDPRLDRKALLTALKENRAIPGAALSNCAPSLTIRKA